MTEPARGSLRGRRAPPQPAPAHLRRRRGRRPAQPVGDRAGPGRLASPAPPSISEDRLLAAVRKQLGAAGASAAPARRSCRRRRTHVRRVPASACRSPRSPPGCAAPTPLQPARPDRLRPVRAAGPSLAAGPDPLRPRLPREAAATGPRPSRPGSSWPASTATSTTSRGSYSSTGAATRCRALLRLYEAGQHRRGVQHPASPATCDRLRATGRCPRRSATTGRAEPARLPGAAPPPAARTSRCDAQHPAPSLLGATNSWFAMQLSVVSACHAPTSRSTNWSTRIWAGLRAARRARPGDRQGVCRPRLLGRARTVRRRPGLGRRSTQPKADAAATTTPTTPSTC